jgi:putative flippase GtrA
MEASTKRDIIISFFVGLVAGLLLIPTLHNIGLVFGFNIAVLIVIGLTLFTPLGYSVAYLLSKRWPVLLQFVKFGIVGGLNSMLDLGVLNILIKWSGIASGLYFSLFKTLSFTVAVINSYFWNKYWTFHSGDGPRPIEFFKFVSVTAVGLAINVGTASLVVNFIGAPEGISPALWANIGAVSSVLISLFWNFIGIKFIVFKK